MLKATTERGELARAMARASHAMEKKGLQPLSNTVKITAFNDEGTSGLQFYSTDGFSCAGTTAVATAVSEGEVVVNIPAMDRIISVIPAGSVQLVENDKTLTIVSGKKRFRVPLLALDYPPEAEPTNVFSGATLPSSLVVAALRRVESCQATSTERPYMSGVMLQWGPGPSLVSSTLDGSRAARAIQPLPAGCELDSSWKCFLPRSLIRSVHEMAEESDELTFNSGTAVFVMTETSMAGCQLPAGNFPDMDHMFAYAFERSCKVSTAALVEALRTMGAAGDSAISVHFSIDGNDLRLTSESSTDTTTEVTDAVELLGLDGPLAPPRPFILAANYSREVLVGFGREVRLGYTADFARFDSTEDDKFKGQTTAIVMYRSPV